MTAKPLVAESQGKHVAVVDPADIAHALIPNADGSFNAVPWLAGTGYATVAASQTDAHLGATGAIGDTLAGLLIVPATTSPGAVSFKDGGGSAVTVFTGGATSVADLKPFFLPLAMVSRAGGWTLTTGANVSVVAVGKFTA